MDAAEVRTVADVEQLTPDERQGLVNERTSTDLTEIPHGLVARARAAGAASLSSAASSTTTGDEPQSRSSHRLVL